MSKKRRNLSRHRLRDLAEDIEDVVGLHPCSNMVRSAIDACVGHICAVASASEAQAEKLEAEDQAAIAYNKLEKIERELRKVKR